jgi:hypothetical protein
MYPNAGVGMPPQPPQPGQSTQVPLGNPQYPPQQPQQAMPQNYGFAPTQQQQAFNQAAARLSVNGDEILDGAGVPAELRGRKVSDVMRIYSALADNFIKNGRGATASQGPQNSQPSGQQNPQGQSSAATQQQQHQNQQQQNSGSGVGDGDFWQNPNENLTQIVRQVVQEAVQPFQQQTLATSAERALERARAEIPDFADLEPDIFEAVKGSSQEALSRPEYWQHAADLARGKRFRPGQNNGGMPPAQQPQQSHVRNFPDAVPASVPIPQPIQQFPQQQQQGVFPGHMPPPQPHAAVPRPQTYQFFTENPGAPSVYTQPTATTLSPQQLEVARLAGIPPEQYHAWSAIQQQGRR